MSYPSSLPSPRGRWLLPLLLGALAIVVSAPGIGVPSKWSDEAATLSGASRTLAELWQLVHAVDAVHGLYYAVMHAWTAVFGTSATAMRLPSLLAIGIATAGVAVLARMLGGRPLAVWSALVFLLLPRVTWLAIEARSYALTVAIGVWATVVLLRALETGRIRWWVGYCLLIALGILANLDVALIVAGHGVTLLWSWRRIRRPLRALVLLVVSALVALALAWPLVSLALQESGQLVYSGLTADYASNMILLEQYFTGATPTLRRTIPMPPETIWAWGAVLLACLGWALMVWGAWSARGRRGTAADDGPSILALGLPGVVVPTLLLLAYSGLVSNVFTARYLAFTSPAAALLIGAAVVSLRRVWARVLLIVLMAVLAAPVYAYQRIPTAKQSTDWSQAAAVVQAHKRDGDGVYWGHQARGPVGSNDARIGVAYPGAYAGLTDLTRTGSAASTATLWGTYRPLRESRQRVASVHRVWAIADHIGRHITLNPPGQAVLRAEGFRMTRVWRGTATDVFLWTRTAGESTESQR